MEGTLITMQDIFVFERQGYDASNRVRGCFRPTGIRPALQRAARGRRHAAPAELFDPAAVEPVR